MFGKQVFKNMKVTNFWQLLQTILLQAYLGLN